MSSIPFGFDISNIVIVILFLIPGYISVQIIKRMYIIERKLPDIETIIWSIFASFLIYIPFGYLVGLESIDKLNLSMFSIANLTILMIITVVGSLSVAFVLRTIFRKYVRGGDLWEFVMRKISHYEKTVYAIIHTKDGKEFVGRISHFGLAPSEKDLVIDEPELIIRDKELKVIRKKWGEVVYFREDEIRQIVFLDNFLWEDKSSTNEE